MGQSPLFRRDFVAPDTRREYAARWLLYRTPKIGPSRFLDICELLEGEVEQLSYEPADLGEWLVARMDHAGDEVARSVEKAFAEVEALEALDREEQRLPEETEIVALGESDYPRRLFALRHPPAFLYMRGCRSVLHYPDTIAMVGSRRVPPDDISLARKLARGVGDRGGVVVSGGALGTDAAVHRGALDADTPTVVILPGGIAEPKPRRNAELFDEIVDNGGVLMTEYPVGVGVRRYHFHRRNYLIAAIGDATCVVRAGKNSGTMITANAARELTRPLCAVPGEPGERWCHGPNKLLWEGADCVRHAADISTRYFSKSRIDEGTSRGEQKSQNSKHRSEIEESISETSRGKKKDSLTEEQKEIFDTMQRLRHKIDRKAVHLDALDDAVDLSLESIRTQLLALELSGVIRKASGANAYKIVR